MGNGATTDHRGGAYICSQGLGDASGALFHCDAALGEARRVGPPDGLVLNCLNDVVVDRQSGELIFTDPAYGLEAQGFRTTYNEVKAVWAVHPERAHDAAAWRIVKNCADCALLDQPNGCLLSPDGRTAYVTDVWDPAWHASDVKLAASGTERARITAYDVERTDDGRPKLGRGRTFADLRAEEGAAGYPDGIKCDVHGNVYAGCGDGARVYAPDGTYLGRFAVDGGVSNLCFGGEDGRTLLLLSETKAYAVQMRVRGALI